jgi:hypothetical protein
MTAKIQSIDKATLFLLFREQISHFGFQNINLATLQRHQMRAENGDTKTTKTGQKIKCQFALRRNNKLYWNSKITMLI